MQVTQINKIDKKQENSLNENNIFECPHCHKRSDFSEIIQNATNINTNKIISNAKKEWENDALPKLEKKYQIKSASFLSDIRATDNIFVNKNFSV